MVGDQCLYRHISLPLREIFAYFFLPPWTQYKFGWPLRHCATINIILQNDPETTKAEKREAESPVFEGPRTQQGIFQIPQAGSCPVDT